MVMLLLHLLYVIHIMRTGVDTLDTPVYIDTGKNVTLKCSFEEKVQWLFKKINSNESEKALSDNKRITHGFSAHYAIIGDETYNLQIINATHSNEGRYWCFTTNVIDNESVQYFQLRLKDRPRVHFLRPKGPVSVGHNVNLSCEYYSNPLDAEILWEKNCQKIAYSHFIVTNIVVENYRKSKEIDVMLTDAHVVTAIIIANVTKADEGAYTCYATNTEGSASETIYLAVQDNDGDTITDSVPPYSGTSVKGFVAKEQILYGMFIVLLVLVLIIISLVAHVYIWNRCKQTNYAVPQREVVRHSLMEIEMQEVSNNESRVNEESGNLPILSEILQDLQNTTSGDNQSDFSKTNTSPSSSSLSNRSQNINEEDYLHPYHGFVNRKLDVHEYDSIDATVNEEYEESVDTSKHKREDYENLRL